MEEKVPKKLRKTDFVPPFGLTYRDFRDSVRFPQAFKQKRILIHANATGWRIIIKTCAAGCSNWT
jgi:hypothetical protein